MIPQFIPIRPRALEGETVRQEGPVPYATIDAGPRPLAVRNPERPSLDQTLNSITDTSI